MRPEAIFSNMYLVLFGKTRRSKRIWGFKCRIHPRPVSKVFIVPCIVSIVITILVCNRFPESTNTVICPAPDEKNKKAFEFVESRGCWWKTTMVNCTLQLRTCAGWTAPFLPMQLDARRWTFWRTIELSGVLQSVQCLSCIHDTQCDIYCRYFVSHNRAIYGCSICGLKYLGLSWAICIKALHQARCRSREFALMRRPCITVRVLYLFSIFIIFSCT